MKSTNNKSFVVDEGILVLSCKHISTPPVHTPFVTSVIYGYLIELVLHAHDHINYPNTLNGLDLARHEKKSLRNQHQSLVDLSGRTWSEKLTGMDEACGTWSRVSDWHRFFSEWTVFVENICAFFNVKQIVFIKNDDYEWSTVEEILEHKQVQFLLESPIKSKTVGS